VEASSGKVVRHRLKTAGATGWPEQCAVHDLPGSYEARSSHARLYVARRTQEGKSKPDIIRCLKRYVARETYRVLVSCVAFSSPTRP
jgi:transposase